MDELSEATIVVIRGHRVVIETELAELYTIELKVLLQAVRRNLDRFPGDFMFQLTAEESVGLRSQSVTSKIGRGGRRYLMAPPKQTPTGIGFRPR